MRLLLPSSVHLQYIDALFDPLAPVSFISLDGIDQQKIHHMSHRPCLGTKANYLS